MLVYMHVYGESDGMNMVEKGNLLVDFCAQKVTWIRWEVLCM